MILIIYAPPRYGKTILATHFANMVAFDRSRTRAMQNEILTKQANGFESLKTIPNHCVAANYDMRLRKFGYTPRAPRRINPFRLGYSNQLVKTHFSLPYEFYVIDEAQKYFNSRMALYYPDWQSRFFEQHGHDNLDFCLTTHRPMLIDPNVRELAVLIEVMKLDTHFNDFGKPNRFDWDCRFFDSSSAWESYMSSGKKDKGCYKSIDFTDTQNLHDCYDHQSFKPKFYDGHMDEDFDYLPSELTGDRAEDYIRILEKFDDEYPTGFYQKRTALC